jgi:hypothetical protein
MGVHFLKSIRKAALVTAITAVAITGASQQALALVCPPAQQGCQLIGYVETCNSSNVCTRVCQYSCG